MDFAPLLSRSADRFRELEAEIASGNLYADPRRARDLLREHTRLKALLADWDNLQKSRADLASQRANSGPRSVRSASLNCRIGPREFSS